LIVSEKNDRSGGKRIPRVFEEEGGRKERPSLSIRKRGQDGKRFLRLRGRKLSKGGGLGTQRAGLEREKRANREALGRRITVGKGIYSQQ